jgi:hypothetical protein
MFGVQLIEQPLSHGILFDFGELIGFFKRLFWKFPHTRRDPV